MRTRDLRRRPRQHFMSRCDVSARRSIRCDRGKGKSGCGLGRAEQPVLIGFRRATRQASRCTPQSTTEPPNPEPSRSLWRGELPEKRSMRSSTRQSVPASMTTPMVENEHQNAFPTPSHLSAHQSAKSNGTLLRQDTQMARRFAFKQYVAFSLTGVAGRRRCRAFVSHAASANIKTHRQADP
jgi:hypothetical protein